MSDRVQAVLEAEGVIPDFDWIFIYVLYMLIYHIIFLSINGIVHVQSVSFARGSNYVMLKIMWCPVTFVSHEYVVAPSEPILSEAASFIMQTLGFSMPNTFADVLSGFAISPGDHGELLVTALITCACDLVVHHHSPPPMGQLCHPFLVIDLFSNLFSKFSFQSIVQYKLSLCHPETSQVPFREAFANTYIHFNHFIKPQDKGLITCGYLLLYLFFFFGSIIVHLRVQNPM
jgi:hypothetical protein